MPKIRSDLAALNIVLDALEDLEDPEREWVLRTAAARFSLEAVSQRAWANDGERRAQPPGAARGAAQAATGSDPKDFLADKRPANDVQRIACLAYYLTRSREQPHFKTLDLTRLNTEAAGGKIGNPAQAVANATAVSRYLAVAGGGKKQITRLGERLVDALPDQEAVRKVLADKPPAVRRAKRSKRTRKSQ